MNGINPDGTMFCTELSACIDPDCPIHSTQPAPARAESGECNCHLDWYETWTCPQHGVQCTLYAYTAQHLASLLRDERARIAALTQQLREALQHEGELLGELRGASESYIRLTGRVADLEAELAAARELNEKWTGHETDLERRAFAAEDKLRNIEAVLLEANNLRKEAEAEIARLGEKAALADVIRQRCDAEWWEYGGGGAWLEEYDALTETPATGGETP